MLDIEFRISDNNQLQFILPRLYLNGKNVRIIELFGGIGSQSKAFEILSANNKDIIFEHHKLVEFDRFCIKSYNAIHGTDFDVSDITKISYKDLDIKVDENIYILTYSFPCQDLSLAGKQKGMQKGSGTRSSLLWEVERLLYEGKNDRLPDILLMENVPQVREKKNLKSFNEWKISLESLGYKNFVKVLNAKDFGIPQSRKRCFMISILDDKHYYFPIKINPFIEVGYLLDKFECVDKRFYVSDRAIRGYLKEDTGEFNRRKIFMRKFNGIKKNLNTITTSYGDVTDNLIFRDNSIIKRVNQIENINNIVPILHNNARRLTDKECLIAMGFSIDDYMKIKNLVSETQIYKQAGNSIVVTVLIAIFAQFYKDIDYEKIIKEYVKNEILDKK